MPKTERWPEAKLLIETNIVNGEPGFAAGDLVRAGDIAEEVGFGLQTVKRAMRQMEAEGTLQLTQGLGYRVKPYVKRRIREGRINEVRQMMKDAMKLGAAIGMTRDELAAMLDP